MNPPISAGTPVKAYACPAGGGLVYCKRDDLYQPAGAPAFGGKARTCWYLATRPLGAGASGGGPALGLITASARTSPQANIVAQIAKALGIPARLHVPQGALGPELLDAQAAGATVVQHRAGYNSVLIARARADAVVRPGWRLIPFGMECQAAVEQTALQVPETLRAAAKLGWDSRGAGRIVISVGSGMSLAGVLVGLSRFGFEGWQVPVLGVVVGAAPEKRLAAYAPGWRAQATLVAAKEPYQKPAAVTVLPGLLARPPRRQAVAVSGVGPPGGLGALAGVAAPAVSKGLALDAYYEAKVLPFLRAGDLFWVVGVRKTGW